MSIHGRNFDEPSVLDYVRSKLGRGPRVVIPAERREDTASSAARPRLAGQPASARLPLLPFIVLGTALAAQRCFEPPRGWVTAGIVSYIAAAGLCIAAALRGAWPLAALAESSSETDPWTCRRTPLVLAPLFAGMAFFSFGGNEFTCFNLAIGTTALSLLVSSLWIGDTGARSLWAKARAFASQEGWQITVSRRTLLMLTGIALVLFFRLHHIQQTPGEPFSDHAEKLLDVFDVRQGQTHIFFPRNTGREAIQMYWTLLVAWVFGTGLSFLSLKIGTVLLGLLTLPYIYLIGREVGGPRVGLIAFVFAGIGYWPNVIARIGLRFPLYPMFVAPLMYYLIRGLRTHARNDFILAGLFLGLGLHGYTPYRIVPFLVAGAFMLYTLHRQSAGLRRDALLWFTITNLIALVVFLPLLRYVTENPHGFFFRALSRVGTLEQPLQGRWQQLLLSNTWNALRMFNWDAGDIWVVSVPHRPALDVVSGALFSIGVVLLIARYIKRRHWLDSFLLLSIPILLLPSILSLAFPDENPALNRASGAFVPVSIVVALALDGLLSAIGRGRARTAGFAGSLLLLAAALENYDLVFRQFDESFRVNAWNSSEMGAVIKQFALTFGQSDTVWVVPFPYWVDTRLPGVWAGIPNRDFAKPREDLPDTVTFSGPKLFIVKANLLEAQENDQQTLSVLRQLYPQGSMSLHRSPVPAHDFWIYSVPAVDQPQP